MGPIGILALQGEFREHAEVLTSLGIDHVKVKKPEQLEGISGLIIPGGESTVIDKLSKIFELREPIIKLIGMGMPVFGTCAGLIMLANEITDGTATQQSFGGLEITVRRNAFGSQVDSFETKLNFDGLEDVMAAFIRAPIVEAVGDKVQVLSQLPDGSVVAVRQNYLLGISFHPEIVGEHRVHEYFIEMCKNANFKAAN